MGTRSLIVVKDSGKDSKEICTIYKHWDGYPDGLGMDLFNHFGDFKIVNGLNSTNPKVANGMGCLAAQIVAVLKNEVLAREKQYAVAGYVRDPDPNKHNGMAGDISIMPPGTRDCWEEYIYTLYAEAVEPNERNPFGDYNALHMQVSTTYGEQEGKPLYDGPIAGFKEWLESENEKEAD